MKIGGISRSRIEQLRPALAAGGRLARWCRGAALDLLYPPACIGCSAELASLDEGAFCDGCLERAGLFHGPTCVRCGAPIADAFRLVRCYRCAGTKLWFDETVALGAYTGLLREFMLRLKHGNNDELALGLADLIATHYAERLAAVAPDVVVPVPMHWRRRLMRGTNSPTIIAERLAGRLRAPLSSDLLCRTRHTAPQFSLPPSERPANVRNAFAVRRGYHLHAAHVMLVDDILTTGSTCSAAARALRQAGAARVTVVVAARTLRQ